MDQLFDIQKVVIGPKYLQARVKLSETAPQTTDQDIEATARIYNLIPHIADHVCVGDKGDTFKEAMPSTELAHLLEHVAVELLAQTGLAGDISSGRTYHDAEDAQVFIIQLSCIDDVLVAGALSSATWIMQWAFTGGADPIPDVEGIVEGLKTLVATADRLESDHNDTVSEDLEAAHDDVLESEPTEEMQDHTEEAAAVDESANEISCDTEDDNNEG